MKALLNLLCGRPAEDSFSERRAQVAAIVPAILTVAAAFGIPYIFARLLRWYATGAF